MPPAPSALPPPSPRPLRSLARCWSLLDRRTRNGWRWLVPLGVAGTALDIGTALLLLRLVGAVGGGDFRSGSPQGWLDWLPVAPGPLFGAICGVVVIKTVVRLGEVFWREALSERSTAAFARHALARWMAAPLRAQLATPAPVIVDEVLSIANTAGRDGIASLLLIVSEGLVVAGLGLLLLIATPGPALGLLALLGGIAGLALHFSHRRHARWGEAQVAARPVLLGFVQGVVAGLREIRISGSAATFLDRFGPIRAGVGRPQVHIDTWRQAPLFLLEVLFVVSACLLLWLLRGAAGIPFLVMAIYAAMRMLPAVNRLVYRCFALQNSLAALARIAGPNEAPPASVPTAASPVPVLARALEIREASFAYPGATRPALRGANLVARAGERLAIVGPSGHGKSTLLLLLAGLVSPDTGEVCCDDVRLGVDDPRWHRLIGYVGQDTPLLDDTIAANIALGLVAADSAALADAVRAARLDEVVARLPQGVSTRIGPNGQGLSGGERQRVALARAFYRQPRLLLLDEATAFLDQPVEQAVLAAAVRPGTTVVFVTHRLATARMADRVAFVRRGRVEACGVYEDLLASHPTFATFAASVIEPAEG